MINYSLGVGLFSFLEAFLFVLVWFFSAVDIVSMLY